MNKATSLLISMLLAFLPLAANAAKKVESRAWVVATQTSEEGESREAFILRVARLADAWTNENQAEVCGYLATDGQRWGVKLLTQRSQVMCITDQAQVPAGLRATKETIHTHPTADEDGKLAITRTTEQAQLAVGDIQLHRMREAASPKAVLRVSAHEGFSPDDFRAGPGYLVQNGQLFHQEGRRKVRELGPIIP